MVVVMLMTIILPCILNITSAEDMKEVQETHELQLKKTYSQGNLETLMKHFKKWTGKDEPKILYFGDSAKSDIYPTKTIAKWDVAAVLEEMETEGMVTTSHNQLDEDDGSPKRKRPKLLELEVEEGKEEVLLSDQWGSLFTDNALLGQPCINGTANTAKHTDEPIKTEGHFYHEMDTFWGDLIRQCSTIAIPTADFITGLTKDHEFSTFSESFFGGFYPGVPKSLLID
ncbi:5'-nucleotidase domain-containing protein 1-like [Actinia tenebrosa]|uniref:5'-nucleotidase domain-containing protein 1-like n=1 Tax=Actinia tenebrosa TaxID=6105 RepID=A0A6P8HBX2_ACTTE|nr:5'-nucleotidase domain-containing protein 1-like [Actinia tenebrosa]